MIIAVAVSHFSVCVVARGFGRSAILSATYRHCAKMELEREARIAKAVSEWFGERTFLGIATREADGEAFKVITRDMTDGRKS